MSPQPARALLALLLLVVPALPLAHAEDPFCSEREQLAAQTGGPPPLCRDPDLVPANMAAYATDERFPSRLCGYVGNIGNDSETKSVPFYVTLILDGDDWGTQRVTSNIVAGYGSPEICWNVTLSAGYHRFHFVADPPRPDAPQGDVLETNENNNAANDRVFLVRPTPQPHLRLDAISVSPPVGRPGTTQYVLATVKNAGDAPSEPAWVEFRDETGVLGRDRVPSVPPGETYRAYVSYFTDERPAGNFTAVAVLDPDNATILDCRNVALVRCRDYAILPHPAPDLAVLNASVRGAYVANRGLLVDAVLANVGDRIAYNPVLRAYDGSSVISNATKGTLSPGESLRVQFYVVFREGHHVLRLVADPDNATVELQEGNNEVAIPMDIAGPPPSQSTPNLVVARLEALPNDPRPEETVMVTALVRNLGDSPSNATSLLIHANGKLLATKEVPSIPASASYSVAFMWGGGGEGTHTLVVRADPDDLVREVTEEDNVLARELDIRPPAPPREEPPPAPPPAEDDPAAPTSPTPPTGETPTPTTPEASGPAIAITALDLRTREVDGKVTGYLGVAVRNPRLEPVGRMSVEFRLDGKVVGDKVIFGIPGAGTGAQRSDDLELTPGNHTVSVSVKILNSAEPAFEVEKVVEVAGAKETPPAGLGLALLAVVGAALLLRRR